MYYGNIKHQPPVLILKDVVHEVLTTQLFRILPMKIGIFIEYLWNIHGISIEYLLKSVEYLLVNKRSYGNLQFIVDVPIENGDVLW